MPLLVSVRGAEEVAAALAGGADIIDAKEPARGALGPVEPEVLQVIAARTPAEVPLSVALADAAEEQSVRLAARLARLPTRRAPVYLKLGFAGVASAGAVEALLRTAVAAAGDAELIAVAYADFVAADAVAPGEVLAAALASGARGLLVDTWRKDGRGLLDHLDLAQIGALGRRCREGGLLFAVAGSLDCEAVARVAPLADVVGVRGAACRGGRTGVVDAGRVAELRRLTDEAGRSLVAG